MIGRTLLHYRILEKLGAGGMGVVYKGRDTHLDRFVAIKVLPPDRVADLARKARFVQEAKAASALNHPNIIVVHDVTSEAGVDLMVMEYVAGKTLAQRIGRKGMRLGELLKIAVQIADALARAHAAGIVHRDLKPANIMVSEEGLVKVLDFGLAKLTEHAPEAGEEVSSLPTQAKTEEGAIAGTAAYMSPEQAEGKAVDARSDIFSFGSVLYEMVTGRRAFEGDSSASTLAAVIKEQPKPLREIAPGLPSDMEKLILRCLQKDPGRRWQSMSDLPVLLRELQEESDTQPAGGGGLAAKTGRRWKLVALPVLLLAIAGGWLLWQRGSGGLLPLPTVEQLTTYPGSELYPCFSPDGNQVAFTWDGEKGDNLDIYVKLVGEMNWLRLTSDPARDEWPAWSPDGKWIAFQRSTAGSQSSIYLVSALGGAERKMMEFPTTRQMSWSPDGQWLVVGQSSGGLYLLPVEGGEPRRLTNPEAPAYHIYPTFSSDGRWLAYAECQTLFYIGDIYVQELGTDYSLRGVPRRITQQGLQILGLAWSRDDESLIIGGSLTAEVARFLWRAQVDSQRPPERLDLAGVHASYPAVARIGNRLAFSREQTNYDIWRYKSDGALEPFITSSLVEQNPQFSPDGSRIAVASGRSGDRSEIWVVNADGSRPIQLTSRLGRYQGTPRWSPDGRWIAFDSLGQDVQWDIWIVEANGGRPRRITSEPSNESAPAWSRDGNWIYFRSDRTGSRDIWRVPFAGGRAEQITQNGGHIALESPDGKDLYFVKSDSSPLFVMPLTGGTERQVLDGVVNRGFVVLEDGIYYIGRPEARLYPLQFFQFSTGQSRLLTRIEGPLFLGLTVSPDRKTWLFSRSVASGSDLMLIENFR